MQLSRKEGEIPMSDTLQKTISIGDAHEKGPNIISRKN